MLGHELPRALGVVVVRHHVRERGVDGRAATREGQEPAVVGAVERHDRGAAGHGARQAQAHQGCLGARIAEANELNGREPLAHELRQPRLVAVRPAQHEAASQRLLDGAHDPGLRMPVEAGGELAEEVDVGVPVEIGQACALAL